jgi:hypothetical protein
MKRKKPVYKSVWTYVADPLFVVNCPHCKNDIFMSTPRLIDRLRQWAMKLKK